MSRLISPMHKTLFCLMLSVMIALPAQMSGQLTAQYCDCQGGTDIVETVSICVGGISTDARVTRCQKSTGVLTDPCGSNNAPDMITFFKSICLDSTINFNIDSVLTAVLCYYDPCKGAGVGLAVPSCILTPGRVCWAYGFPKCWTRTSAGCYVKCGENTGCCWRHRIYCVNPSTGKCELKMGIPNDWSCTTDDTCGGNCIVPTTCTPEPKCLTCP